MPPGMKRGWGRDLVRYAAVVLATLAVVSSVRGDDVTVPIDLQIQLLGRVARYERVFAGRTSDSAHVLVVSRVGHAESQRVAVQLAAALTRSRTIGGRQITVSRHEYSGLAALDAEMTRSSPSILYLAAGLGEEVPAIATALAGRSVLTVSAVGRDVDRGAVLGFELVSSRPQIAVNLRRARAQRLQFHAQLLRLARVVQ